MKAIGKCKISLGSDEVKIAENENGEVFLYQDEDAFLKASHQAQFMQKIYRFISCTAFLGSGQKTIELVFWKEHQAVKKYLEEKFPEPDDRLSAIIKLMEGADHGDPEKFANIISVEEHRELKEMGSNLQAGLGFPGRGFSIIRCTENHFSHGVRNKVFLEIVDSYMEGYAVEHQELTPELQAFAALLSK